MTKRKVSNRPSARTMRRAVAYDRLAAKAHRAGNSAAFNMYLTRSQQLRRQADSQRKREEASDALRRLPS